MHRFCGLPVRVFAIALTAMLMSASLVSVSYADGADKALGLRTIPIDTSNLIPAEQLKPTPIPNNSSYRGTAPMLEPATDYHTGDTERFYVNISGFNFTSLPGILKAQGEHTNVWVIDDSAYHAAKGNEHDTTCHLCDISPADAQEMAATFDGIYERMTDTDTGFGAHARKEVITSWPNIPSAGDIGRDGKVNFVLYDLYGDGGPGGEGYTTGFFTAQNYQRASLQGGCRPIDMLHVDIGDDQGYADLKSTADSLRIYSTLAHEFQHLLFYMYFDVYIYNEYSVSWFNEALSELAATYYVEPGAEITALDRIFFASMNGASGSSYSDFFAHGNLKNYGMEKLFAMYAHKRSAGDFAHNVYNYLTAHCPPPDTTAQFTTNRSFIRELQSMENAVGEMLKAALWDSAEAGGMSGADALRSAYFQFMESFASDGGYLASTGAVSPKKLAKLYGSTFSADNLWGFRPALGTNEYLYENEQTGRPLGQQATAIPILASGGAVSVTGYSGQTSGAVSCEKLYALTPASAASPWLGITVNDSADTADATKYYVALENPAADVKNRGENGADIVPLAKGVRNVVDTGGRRAWLFVSTWFRTVQDVPVYYSYMSEAGGTGGGSGDGGDNGSGNGTTGGGIGGGKPGPTPPAIDQAAKVSVVFDARGGKTGGKGKTSATETYGSKYRLPAAPKRTGYRFAGWYTAKSGGAKVTSATTVSRKTAHTLYAHWNAKKFTIKFNVNKGRKLSKSLAAKKVAFGNKLGKLPTPKRAGYKFKGWYTAKGGGKKATQQTRLTKARTLTLYAMWKKK
jgi:uncharacterized repeat protein (TIGR02543 family)